MNCIKRSVTLNELQMIVKVQERQNLIKFKFFY